MLLVSLQGLVVAREIVKDVTSTYHFTDSLATHTPGYIQGYPARTLHATSLRLTLCGASLWKVKRGIDVVFVSHLFKNVQ
jgi:hypothetical protein